MWLSKERDTGSEMPDSGWILLGLILATAVLLFLNLPQPWPQIAAFALIAIWPMLAWARLIEADWFERLLFGGAAALLLNMLWALLVSYMLGEVAFGLRLLGSVMIAAGPLLKTVVSTHVFSADTIWVCFIYLKSETSRRLSLSKAEAVSATTSTGSGSACRSFKQMKRTHTFSFTKHEWVWIGLLFLLVLGLRLINLSYSEFQGDEGVIMVRAASILTGDNAELFLHQKGPVEILLPMSLWGLSTHINEFWARILFSWAGILSVAAVVAVARRWFGNSTAILAGYLFAIVGFSIAFSRIVQYQSLVVLWGVMALLHAIRYLKTEWSWDLVLSALFLAAGLLAHYDAVLVAPAIVWLLMAHVIKTRRVAWRHWLAAIGVGIIVLAAFYIPFLINPNFGRTGQYLLGARLGVNESTGIFSWSGSAFWRMITLYNSTYFILALTVFVLLGIWFVLRVYRNGAAVLYFAAPFLFYLLIVVDPRTHVYTIFPGAVILGALGMVRAWQWLMAKSHKVSYVAAACFAIWFVVSAVYVYLMFIDYSPERMRTWAENKPAGYWTTWEEPPLYGLFGFPHQAGWRAAGNLVAETGLPYASNEEEEITNWYMKQAPRTHCANFESFMLVEDVQDVMPYDETRLADFSVAHEVDVNGRSSLKIYSQEETSVVQTHLVSNELLWLSPAEAAPPIYSGEHFVEVTLGDDQVRLRGYDLDLGNAHPGGEVIVTLYWQALKPFDQNYQAFVHFYDDGLVGQHDGPPECNVMPTTRWEPGQIVADPHIVALPMEIFPGKVQVMAGMYNLITQERLYVPDTNDNIIRLTNINNEKSRP